MPINVEPNNHLITYGGRYSVHLTTSISSSWRQPVRNSAPDPAASQPGGHADRQYRLTWPERGTWTQTPVWLAGRLVIGHWGPST